MSGRAPAGDLKIGGEPRVQLLPASVKGREKARSARRFMVMLVVLALIVTGVGIGWAYLTARSAQTALDAASSQTNVLLGQQAQYAEAQRLATLVQLTEQAERTVTASEIQWLPLVLAIGEYIPDGVTSASIALTAPAPWEASLAPEGPLRVPRVATVTLGFTSADYGAIAPFVERIPALYGFADVTITSTTFKDGAYETIVVLTLDAEAISGRFAAEDTQDAADDSASTDGSADE